MLFSEILNSLRIEASGGEATVSDDWLQGRATFGGVIAGLGNEAMRGLVGRERPLRSLQTTFIGPASPGVWHLKAEVLRVGRAVTLARCDLSDGKQQIACVVGVYGTPRPSAVAVQPEPTTAARGVEDLREVRYQPDSGFNFMQHFAIRWAEGAKPYSGATQTHTKAFIRHRDPAPLTESHIVALIDCIPSPAFAMFKAPAPASSLIWTLELFDHRMNFTPEQWWRIDTTIDAAIDGYVNQTGILNAPDGQPVALTRQLVAVFG